jgi:hypothetical protein
MSISALVYAASYAAVGVATAPRYYMLAAVFGAMALVLGLSDGSVRTMLRERPRLKLLCLAIPLVTICACEIGRIFIPVPPAMPLLPAF